MGGDGGASMPEEAPAEPAGDHFDNAFKTEINNILDGPGDEDEMASKISALLEHRKGIKEIRGGAPGETDADDSPAGADMEETDPVAPGEKPELIETVVGPSIDVLNAYRQPITSNLLTAVCLMPAKRRRAFVAGLPPAQNVAARSQAGAVGVRETSPRAANRPAKPGTAPAAPAKKPLSETAPEKLLEFARGARVILD